jgi:hypothetical protein
MCVGPSRDLCCISVRPSTVGATGQTVGLLRRSACSRGTSGVVSGEPRQSEQTASTCGFDRNSAVTTVRVRSSTSFPDCEAAVTYSPVPNAPPRRFFPSLSATAPPPRFRTATVLTRTLPVHDTQMTYNLSTCTHNCAYIIYMMSHHKAGRP